MIGSSCRWDRPCGAFLSVEGGGRSAPAGSLEGLNYPRHWRAAPLFAASVLPPNPRLASFGLWICRTCFRLPSPIDRGAVALSLGYSGAPQQSVSSHCRPTAAPNPPSLEGNSLKADLWAGNLLGGKGAVRGVYKEEGKVGRPGRGAAISAATLHGSGSGHCPRDEGRHQWFYLGPCFLPDDTLPFIQQMFVRCLL